MNRQGKSSLMKYLRNKSLTSQVLKTKDLIKVTQESRGIFNIVHCIDKANVNKKIHNNMFTRKFRIKLLIFRIKIKLSIDANR